MMTRINLIFTTLISMMLLLAQAGSGFASTPVVKGSHIRDFHRLTFEWPRPVYLTADVDGDTLSIQFERQAAPDMAAAMKQLKGVITSYTLSADGQTMTAKLKGHYRVRSFVSGSVSGVDIIPAQAAATPTKIIALKEPQTIRVITPPPAADKPEKDSSTQAQIEQAFAEMQPTASVSEAKEPAPKQINVEIRPQPEPSAPVAKAAAPAAAPNASEPAAVMSDQEAIRLRQKNQLAQEETLLLAQTANMSDQEAIRLRQELAQKQAKSKAQEPQTPAASAQPPQETKETAPIKEPAKEPVKAQKTPPQPEAKPEVREKKSETTPPATSEAEPAPEASTPAETRPQGEQPDTQAATATPAEETPQPANTEGNTAAAEKTDAAEAADLPATTDEAATPAEQAAQPTDSVTDDATDSVATGQEETPAEVADEPQSQTAEDAQTPQPEPAEGEAQMATEVPEAEAVEEDNVANKLMIRATLDDEVLSLKFPWQRRTAAASFVRNNTAWIVFSNVATLDLKEVNEMLRAGVAITQLETNEATIIYIPISPGAGVELKSVEGTFRWEVNILPGQRSASQPVAVDLQTEPPLKPHVFLPLLEVAKVVRLRDPIIGDELDVLPVYSSGVGVNPARNFPEFSLLDSTQGLVVLRRSNDTTVELVRNGVRVSTHQGATLTPNLPPPEEVASTMDNGEVGVLLPFAKWKVEDEKDFTDEVQSIKKKLARSPANKTVEHYLRLAQIHLAYGQAVEALGYLQNIKRLDPDLYIEKRLSAMQGAANFLLSRYSDAARSFRVSELKDLEEFKFWDVMLGELLGKPSQDFSYDENYKNFIQHYPPILKQRIGILAADRAIAAGQHNSALKIFDQLNQHQLLGEVADYINYLMGKIALANKQPEDGYKLWEKIINGPATEFVKVRTEFSLIVEKLNRGEMKREEALERLERLAIRWRGDNLELAVLSTLSALYEQDKNWPNAIRIWKSMNQAFPNTVEAVEASRKMGDAYVAVFDKNETGNLADLELMFLYNEHRDLIPDDEVGNRIVEKIADLMIKLDMMEQATSMLERRMRYRFEHAERSKIGAKLAEIYLLDKKPQKALEALQLSVFGMLPDELLSKRTYLSAQALLQLNRYEDMFLLLEHDKTSDADYYRMQAHWQAKNWKQLAEEGEKIMKRRANPTGALTAMESDALIKLAMAYVALGEAEQTAYLRDYFSPLIKGQPKSDLFGYLTQPNLVLTPDNFDQVVELLNKTQTFLAKGSPNISPPAPPAKQES